MGKNKSISDRAGGEFKVIRQYLSQLFALIKLDYVLQTECPRLSNSEINLVAHSTTRLSNKVSLVRQDGFIAQYFPITESNFLVRQHE